jgi:hypothetical protein
MQPVQKRLDARVVQKTHASVSSSPMRFSELKRYSFVMRLDLQRGRLER